MQEQNHPLQLAIEELKSMPKIDIKGKSYTQISTRILVFRKYYPDASITTKILHDDEKRVVVQATIIINDKIVSTGLSEEFRNEGFINQSSALENGETSAIGRALAGLSLMGGSEYASSFEVANAIANQEYRQNHSQPPNNTNQQNYQPRHNQQVQNNTQHTDLSQLTAQGISFVQQGSNIIAVGENLYSLRDLLKLKNFKFNPSSKQWYRSVNNQQVA